LILISLNAVKAVEFSFLTSGNVVNTEIIDVRDYDLNTAKKSEFQRLHQNLGQTKVIMFLSKMKQN